MSEEDVLGIYDDLESPKSVKTHFTLFIFLLYICLVCNFKWSATPYSIAVYRARPTATATATWPADAQSGAESKTFRGQEKR